jgi:hypothetical protein
MAPVMNDADRFDHETANMGGRLSREQMQNEVAVAVYADIEELALQLIGSARQFIPALPHIHFDFILNSSVNAIAFKANDTYFIGVTGGTIAMLQLVFGRMLADRRLLTHIGNPQEESNHDPLSTPLIPNATKMYLSGAHWVMPRSRMRISYFGHLFDQALLFLIGHEVAHIVRGHVDYWQSKHSGAFFAEAESSAIDDDDRLERQTLEADADRRSAGSSASSIKATLGGVAQNATAWTLAPLCYEDIAYGWAFAMNSFFRIFGDERISGHAQRSSGYPPLPTRRLMAMEVVFDSMRKFLGNDQQAFEPIGRALKDVEVAFATIMDSRLSMDGLKDAQSSEGQKLQRRLQECWQGGLRDRLAPYAYEHDSDD